ncbi:ABC transporter permease subunit [Robertmurraya korlensis]|uniref:ABC transporter permease n=1 Tax=Robertmurraya korlensis TaxID=519977 RepID=UPI00203FF369|nr:ABC transporter permease subunit [Robertmurraya korlensis]MCM3600792.1 ABC transporter permease subunit [Robertmurraya korlensis]
MFNLLQNEWMKIFKRPGTFVMMGILLVTIVLMGGIIKYENQDVKANPDWQQEIQTIVAEQKQSLAQMENAAQGQRKYLEKSIAINEYRLDHNLAPNGEYAIWSFVQDASSLIQLAGLFTIIVAAGIVASEFNWGTIKLLLIRPTSRAKILLAKYTTVISFSLLMLTLLFVFSSLVGWIAFGMPDKATPYLNYFDGKVTEESMIFHLIKFYGLNSISMIMLSTMAFMISAVFRNSSLAIGLSIFLMFTGAQFTNLIAMKFEWAKYILFANTDLMQYFEGMPLVEGMTLSFSVLMLVAYFVLFHSLAFFVFKKRDVAA